MKPDEEAVSPRGEVRFHVQILGGISAVVILGVLQILTEIGGLHIVAMGVIGLASAMIYDALKELPEWREEQLTVWLKLRARLIPLTIFLVAAAIVATINYNRWSSLLIALGFFVSSTLVSAVLLYLVLKPLKVLRSSRASLETPPKNKAKKSGPRRRR